MIKDGIITVKKIEGVEVIIDLIPTSNKYARPKNPMEAQSITIHETDNKRVGADGRAHTEYVDNVNNYVSWHFTVDDEKIYQELPIIENAWHAGDGGQGMGNRTSIAIEICVNDDGDFMRAKENAKKLIRYLMEETGIDEIYSHHFWSGKYCPRNILNSGWDEFVKWVLDDDDMERLRKERDYWKKCALDMYNLAEKSLLGGR